MKPACLGKPGEINNGLWMQPGPSVGTVVYLILFTLLYFTLHVYILRCLPHFGTLHFFITPHLLLMPFDVAHCTDFAIYRYIILRDLQFPTLPLYIPPYYVTLFTL